MEVVRRLAFATASFAWVMSCLAPAALHADSPTANPPANPPANSSAPDTARAIERWIGELGAEQYAQRERAQQELQQYGLEAFDALEAARRHDDIEISLRARYLLRRLSFDWSQPTDPPEVKANLQLYSEQSESERAQRIDRLSSIQSPAARLALTRLARYETSTLLAKQAAVHLFQTEQLQARIKALASGAAVEPTELVEQIRAILGQSRRPAADWLRWYCETLEHPQESRTGWQQRIERELAALQVGSADTSVELVQLLLRWQTGYLRDLNRPDEALSVARRMLVVISPDPDELEELVTWYVSNDFWPLVDVAHERFPDRFQDWAKGLYLIAEARRKQGRSAEADDLAARALKLHADSADEHLEVGDELQERGLFDWAEREFRRGMELDDDGDPTDMRCRLNLAEMLWDLERPLEAAQVWQELLAAAEQDEVVRGKIASDERQFFRTRMHLFLAHHHQVHRRYPEARQELEKAIRHDPTDADVLIAMHRLPEMDDDYRRAVASRVGDAAKQFYDMVKKWEQFASQPLPPEQRAEIHAVLANQCNQYAWLVGNTNGNVDEAVRLSHRSLELKPKTGSYYDTLAHCYYAKKDYANAVKYQSIAVKFDPHAQQIQRQAKVFQKALDDSQVNDSQVKP
ncbi:MAG: hypothetical protein ACKOU6_17455 [Planctomycetota bacterium]